MTCRSRMESGGYRGGGAWALPAMIVLTLVGPPSVHAQPVEEPRIGIALHPEFGFALPGPGSGSPGNPGYAAYGVSAGYDLTPRLTIDLGFQRGLSGKRLVMAPAGGVEDFDSNIGYLGRALLHLRVGERALHAVLGGGPALVFAGGYGTVPLIQLEGGLELRARSGFYLLGVLQALAPLASSRVEIAAGRCVTADCPSRFQAGAPLMGSRVAAGYVF